MPLRTRAAGAGLVGEALRAELDAEEQAAALTLVSANC